MGRLMIREFMMDCRNMFRGWKLVLHTAVFGLLIILGRTEGRDWFVVFMVQYSIWTSLFMKPKLGKLFYLLPTRIQDRRYYLLCKGVGIIIYNMLISLIVVSAIGISKHPVTELIIALFSDVIPVFLAYGSMAMGNAYNWGKSRDAGLSKKYQSRYAFGTFLMTIPMMKAMFLDITELHTRIPSVGIMIAMIIVSYLCAFTCLFLQISILWNTELSPENERKVEKLFS